MQTTNAISFLQRGVVSFVMFASSSVPLRNSFHWNPAAENLTGTDIPALFGYIASNLFDMNLVTYDFCKNKFFYYAISFIIVLSQRTHI